MEDKIEKLIDEKMEALAVRLEFAFRSEVQRAINNLRGERGTTFDGVQYLKSSAVCALLEISESTLYRMRKANEIGFILKNRTYYFKADEVGTFMAKDYVGAIPAPEFLKKKRGTKSSLSNLIS